MSLSELPTKKQTFYLGWIVFAGVLLGFVITWLWPTGAAPAPVPAATKQWSVGTSEPPISLTDVDCLVSDLVVKAGLWHIKMHNVCDHRTAARLYVRLAFYDKDQYRHGFTNFIVEPLPLGGRVRLDGHVPREGATSAKVFAITGDAFEALKWGF
jgi:hypothetical protein